MLYPRNHSKDIKHIITLHFWQLWDAGVRYPYFTVKTAIAPNADMVAQGLTDAETMLEPMSTSQNS